MKKALPFLLLPLLGCQHVGLRTAEGALIAGAAYEFADNRGARLSRMADAVEHRMPLWAQYDRFGDVASWVHHALWTATVGGTLCLVGELTGSDCGRGFSEGAWIMTGFYLLRESLSAFDQPPGRGPFIDRRAHQPWQRGVHTGWVVDGTFDVLFPFAVAYISR